MRCISHLDLQRSMQRALQPGGPARRAVRRDTIPIVNLAFATALAVGAQSRCELMDVELEEAVAHGGVRPSG